MKRSLAVTTVSAFAIMVAIASLAIVPAFGKPGPFADKGTGKHTVVAPGIVASLPTDADYNTALQLRTAAIERGESTDPSAAENKKADPLLPKQKVKALKSPNEPFAEITQEEVIVPYENRFAVDSQKQRQLLLHRMKTDGGIYLTEDQTTSTPHLVRSRKGQYLFTEHGTIWVLDADTLKPKQVTKDDAGGYNREALQNRQTEEESYLVWASQPKWSSDGSKIAYFSNRGKAGSKGGEIWVADLTGETESKVYSSDQWLGIYGWTSSNDMVLWEGTTGNTKIVKLDGTIVKRPLDQAENAVLDPTGSRLVYSTSAGATDFWVYDIESGSKQQFAFLQGGGSQFDSAVRFSPDGKRLVYLEYTGNNGERTIHVYDFITKASLRYDAPSQVMIASTPEWVDNDNLLVNGLEENDTFRTWTLQLDRGNEK